MPTPFSLYALPGLPMVGPGDDLAALIIHGIEVARLTPETGDIICIAQKVVSKAEGRQIRLDSIQPSERAQQLARETEKDPRLVQLILDESTEILRIKPGVLIVRHRLGLVGANAGIDQSNITHDGGECALLLPVNPDASAARLKADLEQHYGCIVGILITDSHNRPWRLGTIGVAIGAAGVGVLDDRRGGQDLFGRELKVTMINRADSIASAATLLMGETTEATPVVLVRGAPAMVINQATPMLARAIERPLDEDLFR